MMSKGSLGADELRIALLQWMNYDVRRRTSELTDVGESEHSHFFHPPSSYSPLPTSSTPRWSTKSAPSSTMDHMCFTPVLMRAGKTASARED